MSCHKDCTSFFTFPSSAPLVREILTAEMAALVLWLTGVVLTQLSRTTTATSAADCLRTADYYRSRLVGKNAKPFTILCGSGCYGYNSKDVEGSQQLGLSSSPCMAAGIAALIPPQGGKVRLLGTGKRVLRTRSGHKLHYGVPVDSFRVIAVKPKLQHIFPTLGQPGMRITISGRDFGNGNTNVFVGSTKCGHLKWTSPAQISCEIADGVGRHLAVNVNTAGQFASGTGFFSYRRPHISFLQPQSVLKGAPATITVHGKHFGRCLEMRFDSSTVSVNLFSNRYDSNPSVRLGKTACDVTQWKSDELLTCSVAKGEAAGSWQLQVTVGGQKSKLEAGNLAAQFAVRTLAPTHAPSYTPSSEPTGLPSTTNSPSTSTE